MLSKGKQGRGRPRQLTYERYAALLLLQYYSPSLTTLRSIQRATKFRKVRKIIGCPRVSLGALSEASKVFDPEILRELINEAAGQLGESPPLEDLPDPLEGLTAVDGTVLRALPRMAWATWLRKQNGVKAHVAFNVVTGAPEDAIVTNGAGSERGAFREMLKPGRLYVLDCGYTEYRLIDEIVEAGSSCIMRLRDDACFEVLEERVVTEKARDAGVQRDLEVRLGKDKTRIERRMHVVEIVLPEGDTSRRRERVLLATDRLDLTAELVAFGYGKRWQVELFFRWFKCILGCEHLLSESRNGLTIQIYIAILAGLLVRLWTGRKPNKETWEVIQHYLTGWAEEDEVEEHLESLKFDTRS